MQEDHISSDYGIVNIRLDRLIFEQEGKMLSHIISFVSNKSYLSQNFHVQSNN